MRMAPTPVLLPGKPHGWRSLVGCSPWGREESDTTEQLRFHFSLSCTSEGNGNPLQCSCLQNPRDGGAWWAAVYGSHRVGHDWSGSAAAAAYLYEVSQVINFIGMQSKMMIPRDWGERERRSHSLFYGHTVSVLQDEKDTELCCTAVWMYLTQFNYIVTID